MTVAARGRRRPRGRIETLPSGSLRVQVYAGIDPVSKIRHYLTETIPAGPTAAKEAERARTRLLAEVDQRRSPRTRATVGQLLDRWLDMVEVGANTRAVYVAYITHHILPVLGQLPLNRVTVESLESFYAMLRRCRAHCDGRRRDPAHDCHPLSASTVRQIHSVLSGAFGRAVRWGWLGVNVAEQAARPAAPVANPEPPTAEQAARIVSEAWKDPDWGMLVWLAMVTGARRGELCALTWQRIDFTSGVMTLRTSIAQRNGRMWEKDLKTHQQRRITLDDQTLALLRAHRRRVDERVTLLGLELRPAARVFSRDPDGSTWLQPDSVTQRYARMCRRLGWNMHLHQLRHYSATELIATGVDVRTVAGRLGHGGGRDHHPQGLQRLALRSRPARSRCAVFRIAASASWPLSNITDGSTMDNTTFRVASLLYQDYNEQSAKVFGRDLCWMGQAHRYLTRSYPSRALLSVEVALLPE